MRSEKQIELLEARVAALEALTEQQGEINAKMLIVLRGLQEKDKTPKSKLILPEHIN